MSKDTTYFMRRAVQERSAAEHAIGDQAREVHAELAKRYRHLAKTARDELAGEAATQLSSRT